MNKLSLALVALVSSLSVFGGATADAQIVVAPLSITGTFVPVSCVNGGGSQDVVKTPSLKNDTGKIMLAGNTVSWKSSDGDQGSIKLTSDLAPGATLKLQGTKPGNAYTCTASLFALPDLVPTKAILTTPTQLSVSFTNRDPFASAQTSQARIEIRTCSGTLLFNNNPTFALGPGQTKTYSILVAAVPPKAYVRLIADKGLVIPESNESNNVLDTMNSCLN